MRVSLIDQGTLRDLLDGAQMFRREVPRQTQRAAQRATAISRSTFQSKLSGRPHVPPRPGRPTTGGQFPNLLQWTPQQTQEGTFVAFNLGQLAGRAPYWLIQEIGTGRSATILNTGERVGVRSQVGRPIPRTLSWADASASYDVPLSERTRQAPQQLMSVRDVKNAPLMMDLEPQRIRKEIEGKHYIRDGGMHANREYQLSLESLARRAFSR